MAEYQLTNTDIVTRMTEQGQMLIPNDPDNHDWRNYELWLAAGGVPDPYVPPPPAPSPPASEDVVLYNHENRLRAIEGQPPLSYVDFTDHMQRGSDGNA